MSSSNATTTPVHNTPSSNNTACVGIIGGGQLARMLILAGMPLGISFRVLSEKAEEATQQLGEHFIGSFSDTALLRRFAEGVDCITYEFENLPVSVVTELAQYAPVRPGVNALAIGQDRLQEKALFTELGISTAPYRAVNSLPDLRSAYEALGPELILKTTRLGYDGKGQARVGSLEAAEAAFDSLAPHPLIAEGVVPFTAEISQIVTRSVDGSTVFYPLTENTHREGILETSTVPSQYATPAITAQARDIASRIASKLEYLGTLAVELFLVNNQLCANEIAPRVHNSGHWSIDGAVTSQFENHLRAILGWPLGDTALTGTSVRMENIIGEPVDAALSLAERTEGETRKLHWYGKSVRSGRKVGHVTRVEREGTKRNTRER